jgi:predicted ATPase
MIISISGAQGQGKSTVLSSLKDRGFNVIENKTARSILADWQMNLSQIYKDHSLTISFHEEIVRRHSDLCEKYQDETEVYYVERSFADIFAYASTVLGPYNEHNDWIESFYEECAASQASFAAVIYLTGRNYIPENDGVRSINRFYSEAIDHSIYNRLKEFSEITLSHRAYGIDTPSNEERVRRICDIANLLRET